jgi:hypothetical protein
MNTTSKWMARCKSGYVMESTDRPCSAMCSRGQLLCSGCATAQPVEPEPTVRMWGFAECATAVGLVMLFVIAILDPAVVLAVWR